jgi:outer membrane immunogenic protein
MKRTFVRCVGLFTLAVSNIAFAADLSVPQAQSNPSPIYNWTGFYLGINGGGAWGQSSQTPFGTANPSTGNFNLSGGLVGGTVGFNYQLDSVVLGLEGDFDWANVSGSVGCPGIGITCTTKTDYLGTVRGRLGYAWYQWLPYVTVGAAAGDIKQGFLPAIGINNGEYSNRIGWTAGGGVEFAFQDAWSAKVEYLHVDLGTFICGVACSGIAVETIHTPLTEDLVRAGIDHRF